jgi:hypothetical protein
MIGRLYDCKFGFFASDEEKRYHDIDTRTTSLLTKISIFNNDVAETADDGVDDDDADVEGVIVKHIAFQVEVVLRSLSDLESML